MKSQSLAATTFLLGLLTLGAAHAQQARPGTQQPAREVGSATATSNEPSGSGEASTMTNGVPNLVTSNPQPGELGIQTRMTVRQAAASNRQTDTRVMGAPTAVAAVIAPRRMQNAPAPTQGGTPD